MTGRRLVRRRNRRLDIRAATATLRRFPYHLVLVVVEHLADGQRLDRHRDHVLPRRRRDLGRAGEAGPDVRYLLVERDHHPERRRLALSGVLRRGLDRAVADLGDVTAEGPVRHGVDGHLRHLSNGHRRDFRLVYFNFGLDDRHVGDRQQHRSGIVHRPEHRGLALFDATAGDQAVHRGRDDDLIEVVLRGRQSGFLHLDPLLVGLDLLLACLQFGFADGDFVLGPFERFAGRQLFLPQFLRSLEVLASQIELRACLLHGRA